MGTAIGLYLSRKGLEVLGYYSKTLESSQLASKLTGARAYEDLSVMVGACDVIFITTNDDSIKDISNKLSEEELVKEGQIVIHMSGSHSSGILENLKKSGCATYSLHPLQSFASVESSVEKLEDTVFTLEGCQRDMHKVESILEKTQNRYFKIDADSKTLYHAGACVISNYLVTLMDFGLSFFDYIGIKEKDAFAALKPLVEGTIGNIGGLGCKKALTGPIARGDIETLKRHVGEIEEKLPGKLELYRKMALMTLDLSSGLPSDLNVKEMKCILGGKKDDEQEIHGDVLCERQEKQ